MNPRPRAARLRPDARREQLLAHALAMFAERGLGAARHSDLALRSAVSLPTTLHYFPSLDALRGEILREVSRFLLEDVLAAASRRHPRASDALIATLLGFEDAIDTHPNHVRIWLEWSVAVRGALWPSYLDFRAGALAGVKQLLTRGKRQGCIRREVDTGDAAQVIVSLAHMIVQMKFAGSSRSQVAHAVRSLVMGYLAQEP
jgi:TetR/AcrR family hemagglutinin/protease transcriptional regulator